MWAVVPASVVGTSHERLSTPCQDALEVLRLRSGGEDLLLIAIADGAGSATHSDIGSSEATRHLLAVISRNCPSLNEVTKEQVRGWMDEVLIHLTTIAERESVAVSQLACTILLGIIGKTGAVFSQIGDGAWVAEKDGALMAVTWPENGEYVNVTTFITTQSAFDTLQFERVEGKISSVAGFTDGLQSLGLNFSTKGPHEPFFAPMFRWVRECSDETSLIAPLQSFLASESITSRTDDDKTLVLACWRDVEVNADAAAQ